MDLNSSVTKVPSCAVLLEALLATVKEQPDAPDALRSLDSLMQTVPGDLGMYGNLLVARMQEAAGDLDAALRAVRRRGNNPDYLSSFLRMDARLAALTGDRKGAIRAYQHYLALRSDPEPALQADANAARAELQRLLRERR